MSSLALKNVKIQDPTGTLVSTLSYDGTNITIDKPVLAPTAAAGTNNTQLATTAMVHSAITNDLHATGSAPMYACRAWANFDGTQSVPPIRASGNVSSITKNGTGNYTVNFTTAMPDANFAAVSTSYQGSTGTPANVVACLDYNTSSVHLLVSDNNGDALYDGVFTNVAIFR
jgi:hypothetical protein